MKITVLGAAGGIGQALSLLLKMKLPAGFKLALYDVAPVAPGIAVDLSHIPTDVAVKGFTGDDLPKALEASNVNVVDEMTNLIRLQRQFETQVKMMQTAEKNDEAQNQLLRMS